MPASVDFSGLWAYPKRYADLKNKDRVLRISNTLSGRLEEFQPLVANRVQMYTCGPTVYDFAHIGNFRTFVFEDILKRFLKFKGFEVMHVMNVTDVDDRTIRNSGATEPRKLREYTDRFTQAFLEDCQSLRIEKPDLLVRATDHIDDMVAMILRLKAKGYTYEQDGSTYFKICQFKDYGKLSKLDVAGIRPGARVDVDEYEKQDARDFVLWKAAKTGEPYWDSPLGPGRPGWHIECSAMSTKYLGASFDLHCGAVDLIFPHHENEIAQSEADSGKPFVRYWVHGEHLLVEGEKMAKSKGNFFTLRDPLSRENSPSAVRYTLLSVPYKRQLNFSFDAVRQAESSLQRIEDCLLRLTTESLKPGRNETIQACCAETLQRFAQALDDDLNTAQALAAAFDLVRDVNAALAESALHDENRPEVLDTMVRMNEVLNLWAVPDLTLDDQVRVLIEERNRARQARNFALADQIRNQLHEMGYTMEDTKEGVRWKKH
jgi:cysteinyl-tRNA synthetase